MLFRSRSLASIAFVVLLLAQLSGAAEVALVKLVPPLAKLAQEGKFGPPEARANGRYNATGGVLNVGQNLAITTVGTSGNTGSWRGTLSPDGWGWSVSSTAAGGMNQILYLDNVELHNANKMVVSLYASSGSASLQRYYQICDWVNPNKVDAGNDSDCTGGGWRTLHKVDSGAKGRQGIAEAALRYYTWHIYDGYWNNDNLTTTPTTHEPQSTPLQNFVSSTGRVMVRAYAPSGVATTHIINWLAVDLVVDPIYMPAEAVVISGTQTGESSYVLAQSPPTLLSGTGGTTGSDNGYLKVSGTAGSIADFYVRFKNVRTYTGANAIAVVAEFGCSSNGTISHKPKVWNFYSSSWEDLSVSGFTCSTTDAAGQFGFTTSSLWKYIRDGEVRVGWYGSGNSTQEVRLDYIYMIVGSTVSDPSRCEVSYGTGVATQCDRMNDMDSALASTTGWMVGSQLDTNSGVTQDFYTCDNDCDAVANDANVATHATFPVRVPSDATMVSLAYSVRATPGSNTASLQPQFKDWWGLNPTASGGYTNFGTIANSTTTYGYTDPITHGYFTTSSQHYINTYDDTVEVRFRTAASSLLGQSFTRTFDWAMVSISWIEEDAPRRSIQYNFPPTDGRLRVGTENPRLAAASSGNHGSWRALLNAEANDGFNWTVTTSGSGLNQQVDFDYVKVNNANKMVITLYASSGSASLMRWYQICDWATTTAVDDAADQDCNGGWRSLNKYANFKSRQAYGDATRRTYTYHIYEGYWNVPLGAVSGTSNRIASTSLSNFVSSTNGTVRIRAYSTSTTATTHMFNYASIQMVVDPVYMPQGLSVITGQSQGESAYVHAQNPQTLVTGSSGQSGSDNTYARASGTASVTTEFYLPFRNVRTYDGANALLVVAETGCSATGINYTLRVYNFTTPGWESISTARACAAAGTDTTGYYSKSNVNLANYVSNGEVRIGMLGSANGTQELRIDWIYLVVGTVNTVDAGCRIDYGTNSANDCKYTRNIDTAGTAQLWSVSSALESAAMASDYYALAGDADATAEHITSVVIPFTHTMVTGTSPAGMFYSAYWRSGGTGKTTQPQLLDFSGSDGAASAGWTNIATTNAATTTYTYSDAITNGYLFTTPENYIDPVASSTVLRVRSSAATFTTLATVSDFDFFMVSYRWVDDPNSADITLSLDDTTWAMDPVTGGGGDVEPAFNAAVDSTNGTGFTLYLKRNSADATLDLTSDPATNITDKAEWIAPGVTTTAGNAVAYTGTGLAFRLGEATDVPFFSEAWWGPDLTPLYAGVPTTSQAVAVQSFGATANAKIFFRLAVPITQQAGSYDGQLTLTASINP